MPLSVAQAVSAVSVDVCEPGRRCDVLKRLLVLSVDRSDWNAARSPSEASLAILMKNTDRNSRWYVQLGMGRSRWNGHSFWNRAPALM